MKHVRHDAVRLARRQNGVVAVWQLVALGHHRNAARRALRHWRRMHDGVYLAGLTSPTQLQRWTAAVLTAPDTVLSHASAAAFWGLARPPRTHTVTRPGRGAPRVQDDVLVRYSQRLTPHTIVWDAIPVTRPERTIIDCWPALADVPRRKLLREALRTRRTTTVLMRQALSAHRGARGTASLRQAVERCAGLQIERCRSDAEALAMETLDDAGLELPEVNVDIAGYEADLVFARAGLIIELDGPGVHRLKDRDAQRTVAWRAAGYRVRRLDTDALFADPPLVVALARDNGVPSR